MALCALALPAFCQDVSVSPLEWADPKDPPDEAPAFQRAPRVDFPTELRATPDVGYVVFNVLLDPKGRHLGGAQRHGSMAAYVRLAELSLPDWHFSPAKRDGKAVNCSVNLALLFNPASARANGPEASPRLLEVEVVHVPAPKGTRPTGGFEDQVVFADLTVDETGHVAAVKNAPPALADRMAIAAKLWRFAPARHAGQAVAAEVHAPFVIVTGGPPRLKGNSVQPRPTFQARPEYPLALRRSGLRGEVVVDFVVDIEGRVRRATVVRSLNPAFDDCAVEAVQKWKFEPARVGDVPVNTHMQVPIIFQLDGVRDGGGDGIEVTKKADMAKLPEELRYDTPPRLTGSVRSVYPYPLLAAGKTGEAVVAYLVNGSGHVVEARVTKASTPEFGAALVAAIESFTYEPALKAGRPGRALLSFRQTFDRDEEHQLVSYDDLELLRREQKKPQTIVGLSEIDGKLVPRAQRSPLFPVSEARATDHGEALIEFIVDEDGRARLPRAVSATNDAFAYAAIQGVASWRFEPATHGGRPTAVRVKVPIAFKLQPAVDAR
jgi:TonB family protein